MSDWTTARASAVRFASITVTESNNWSDPTAERQITAAQRVGIHTGARHYARPGAVQDQAQHFVRTGRRIGAFNPGSLAPALEVAAEGVDDRFIRSWIKAMRQASKVRRVLVYAGHEHWESLLSPDKWADSEVVLWLARHNGIPGRPGWFHQRLGVHQHGNEGALLGLGGTVRQDAIVYPFTLADLLI